MCPTRSPAKLAHPDRPVVAMVGDGAMQMLGINALITLAREWRRWADPRFVVMVLNNGDLNQVTWEQRAMGGDPKFEGLAGPAGFSLCPLRRAAGARRHPHRAVGRRRPRLGACARRQVPTAIEFVTDPEMPPLPPHITSEQAKAFLSALIKRDPAASRMFIDSMKDWWDGLFPPAGRS